MVINSSITAFAETYDNVDLISNYGVVIDYETGQVLGGKTLIQKFIRHLQLKFGRLI